MYALHSFIDIPSMVVNTPGLDSPLGELSTRSKTFSRELGFYNSATYPDVKMTTFSSLSDGVKVAVPVSYRDLVLQISQHLYDKSVDGVYNEDTEACRQNLAATFENVIEVVSVSTMVTNGTYWLPGGVVFRQIGEEQNLIKIWFSNDAFRRQYELFEIVVVPPVDTLDDLHRHRAHVLSLLQSITIPDHLRKVQFLATNKPYTYLISSNYNWVDPNDPQIKQSTPWSVIIYGESGNNSDIIREHIVDYVLANSEKTREEWEVIYPDLFLPNEYYITPFWDRFSLPNQRTAAGMYSPTSRFKDHFSYAASTFHMVPVNHIHQNMTVSGTTYKGLQFIACSNEKNRDPRKSFDELWPAYIDITTNSVDFNRVPADTQAFIRKLIHAFVICDNIDQLVDMPEGVSHVTRGNNRYLTMNHNDMQYLISLKSNQIYEQDGDPSDPNILTYVMNLVVSTDVGGGVVGQIFEKLGNALTPLSNTRVVAWEATWYDGDNQVIREANIALGTPEQLIFNEPWDGLTAGHIDVKATLLDVSDVTVEVFGSQPLLVLIPNPQLDGLYLNPDLPQV